MYIDHIQDCVANTQTKTCISFLHLAKKIIKSWLSVLYIRHSRHFPDRRLRQLIHNCVVNSKSDNLKLVLAVILNYLILKCIYTVNSYVPENNPLYPVKTKGILSYPYYKSVAYSFQLKRYFPCNYSCLVYFE